VSERYEGTLSRGEMDVILERRRQVNGEGWTAEHDDTHDRGEMALAAAAYAIHAGERFYGSYANHRWRMAIELTWPWTRDWFKTGVGKGISATRRCLVKAGALILAEIDRLDRLAERQRAAMEQITERAKR
jgi:hypothetical protein